MRNSKPRPAGKTKKPRSDHGARLAGVPKIDAQEAFDASGENAAGAGASAPGLAEASGANWTPNVGRRAISSTEAKAARVPVNVSLDRDLLAAAKELGVNISRAAEFGVAAEVARARGERWLAENRAAIESSNEFVKRCGLPLERYRNF